MKKIEIIQKILSYHPEVENYKGCDEFKSGFENEECTGIAVSLSPSFSVLKAAAATRCNLLITHEPLYYQTPDFPDWKGNYANSVYEEKLNFIHEKKLTIWRDHDHMHFHKPDCIFSGVINELGWNEYYTPKSIKGNDSCYCFEIPETTVDNLISFLKKKLNMKGIRYLGCKDERVTKVAIVGHLFPNCFFKDGMTPEGYYNDYSMEIIKKLELEGVQVIIPGETIEWTVLDYIRDRISMGKPAACLSIGHFKLEELGMKNFSKVIEGLFDTCGHVTYIPTDDGYSYL